MLVGAAVSILKVFYNEIANPCQSLIYNLSMWQLHPHTLWTQHQTAQLRGWCLPGDDGSSPVIWSCLDTKSIAGIHFTGQLLSSLISAFWHAEVEFWFVVLFSWSLLDFLDCIEMKVVFYLNPGGGGTYLRLPKMPGRKSCSWCLAFTMTTSQKHKQINHTHKRWAQSLLSCELHSGVSGWQWSPFAELL